MRPRDRDDSRGCQVSAGGGPLKARYTVLSDVADVRPGRSFRGAVANEPGGDVGVVQIRDLCDESGVFGAAHRIVGARQPELLRAGDVLLASRGDVLRVAMVRTEAPLIASGQVYVIRPRAECVVPAFVRWALQQPEAQEWIRSAATQGRMPMLPIAAARAIPVPVPSLQAQARVVDLAKLFREKRRTLDALMANESALVAAATRALLAA